MNRSTDGAHWCHCGHEKLFHFSTNNECAIFGCPCAEGFQPKWMTVSPRLKAALDTADAETRERLQNLDKQK